MQPDAWRGLLGLADKLDAPGVMHVSRVTQKSMQMPPNSLAACLSGCCVCANCRLRHCALVGVWM